MSKHHSFLDTVDEVFKGALNNGVWQLSSDVAYIETTGNVDGRLLKLKTYDKPLINFGNCSYLGLETDERLKRGAIEATLKHGTQVSSSRAYLSSGLYDELEAKFDTMFGGHVVIAPTTTLGHFSSLPTILADNDAVILDQFVHASVQRAVTTEKSRGVYIDVLRHNRLDKLEDQIKALRQKHGRVWYMIDGVYSMYGQLAPIKPLVDLLNKYEQFHLYVDDAHGMGWAGKFGRGYTLSQTELHPKMIVATSLAKAFGTTGGVIVFPDKEMAQKVRTVGYTLIFSGPLVPPVLGASLASAEIMLSDELPPLQHELMERIRYGNRLIVEKRLPYVELSDSPIFFICLGHPKVGYNISRRLMLDGFYTNLAIFPAVPVKNTGLRLTFTLHTRREDIKNLLDAVEYHLPKALEDEGRTMDDVIKAFKIEGQYAATATQPAPKMRISPYNVKTFASIQEIDRKIWNQLFSHKGSFDWDGLELLENTFRQNAEKENNWKMRYYLVTDSAGKIVAATFFTLATTKDDMLASARVSASIEAQRKTDPYYLCSLQYGMGSPLTEGEHLFIDRGHSDWRGAIKALIEQAQEDRVAAGAKTLVLRDFAKADTELKDFFISEGFFHYDMPDNHVVDISRWSTPEEYFSQLSWSKKKHVRYNALRHRDKFIVEYGAKPNARELQSLYAMYRELKARKYELNTFDLPFHFFEKMLNAPGWELIMLYVKPGATPTRYENIAGFCFCYINGKAFCPMLIGTDTELTKSMEPYRQMLYQTLVRGKQHGCEKVYLAFTASTEKTHFGAWPVATTLYMDTEDNFAFNKMAFA